MTTHVSFERRPDGSILRVETPDAPPAPTPYDRQLTAARPPAPPVHVETRAELDAVAKAQNAALVASRTARPEPVDAFVHSSTERRGDKIVVTRTRRDGSKVTHEVTVPPALVAPVERGPEALHGPLSYEERLRRQRLMQP